MHGGEDEHLEMAYEDRNTVPLAGDIEDLEYSHRYDDEEEGDELDERCEECEAPPGIPCDAGCGMRENY